ADEGLVGQHPLVEEEDLGGLGAHVALGGGADLGQLAGGGGEGPVKAGQLGGDGLGGDLAARDPLTLVVERKDPAEHNAGRDRDAPVDLHAGLSGILSAAGPMVAEGSAAAKRRPAAAGGGPGGVALQGSGSAGAASDLAHPADGRERGQAGPRGGRERDDLL